MTTVLRPTLRTASQGWPRIWNGRHCEQLALSSSSSSQLETQYVS